MGKLHRSDLRFFLLGLLLTFCGAFCVTFLMESWPLSPLAKSILDPVLLSALIMYPLWRMSKRTFVEKQKTLSDELDADNGFYRQQVQGLNRSAIVSISDRRGRIIYVNENFVRVSGHQKEDLYGTDHKILSSFHHSSEFWKEMYEKVTTGQIWKGEVRNRKKDGTIFWTNVTIVPVLEKDNSVREFLSIQYEITEEKELARSQEEEKAKLIHSSRMATMGEMSGGLAHEMNTPLAVIVGKSGHLMRKIASGRFKSEDLLKDLDKIESTAIRISKIINGLKIFSGVDENMPYVRTNFRSVIQDTLDLVGEKLRLSGIELHISSPETGEIYCKPMEISQVLMNLILNAKDAVEQQPDKIIWIETKNIGDYIELAVMDSGSGVSEKNTEKIMNPFFTTKPLGKGTGLGLSISKGIIDQHDGQLFLDRRSKRTRFVIRLPILQQEQLKKAA